jgi:hypothetical protein
VLGSNDKPGPSLANVATAASNAREEQVVPFAKPNPQSFAAASM